MRLSDVRATAAACLLLHKSTPASNGYTFELSHVRSYITADCYAILPYALNPVVTDSRLLHCNHPNPQTLQPPYSVPLAPLLRFTMSRSALRKQSLVSVAAPSAGSTPWDTQARPCVADLSTYLEHAKSLCPHLITDPSPPSPPAATLHPPSTASLLLRLTRLQAEWEERQLAAYQKQISDEYASLVSSQSMDEQRNAQQLLQSCLDEVSRGGGESSLATHVRHVACSPSAVLSGLTSEQQTSADRTFPSRMLYLHCHPKSSHPTHPSWRPSLCMCCQRSGVVDDGPMWRSRYVANHGRIDSICHHAIAGHAPKAGQHTSWRTVTNCGSRAGPLVSIHHYMPACVLFTLHQERAVAALQSGQQRSEVQLNAITSFWERLRALQHKVQR